MKNLLTCRIHVDQILTKTEVPVMPWYKPKQGRQACKQGHTDPVYYPWVNTVEAPEKSLFT